jgi:hypothetical protein
MNDNIVEEIHVIREKIFAECGQDSEKLAEYYMKLQKESSKPPKTFTTDSRQTNPKSIVE